MRKLSLDDGLGENDNIAKLECGEMKDQWELVNSSKVRMLPC